MKSFIAPAYTFTPGTSGVGTVNLSGISGFNIKFLVSIINQTRGEIIYSTASSALRFTNVVGTTVTLFRDTSAMNSVDVLQVIYEDPFIDSALSSIDAKTPVLDNSKQPVVPSMTTGGNLSVQTAATGTSWTAFASQALKQLTISNQTGVTTEFRQSGTGVGFQIPAGTFYTFFGITNANQLEARRVDTLNAQVTITARWEA
jgi:hypothetical protein